MEENVLQEKPGLFTRVAGIFNRHDSFEDEIVDEDIPVSALVGKAPPKPNYRYTVTVRRQVVFFEDAYAAANGLKAGEQQILNLAGTDPLTRQKIVDFMSGVNFSEEGTWEEIGDNIYLIVPTSAYVEVVPPSTRGTALKN
jgi:FtsZ-interacting cell division protein YlmF